MRRPLNQLSAIVERHDANTRRQARLQSRDLLFDGIDNFERVHTVARDYHTADRFLAVLVQGARAKGVAELHIRYVLDVNPNAVRGSQYNVFDIRDGLNQSDAAHDRPLARLLDHVTTDVIVGTLNSFDHHR